MEATQPTSAKTFLAVTVRGCDGKEVFLSQVATAPQPHADAYGKPPGISTAGTRIQTPAAGTDGRDSYFIGNTIANLRDLDPSFGARTLTLVDGRRAVPATPQTPARAAEPAKTRDEDAAR